MKIFAIRDESTDNCILRRPAAAGAVTNGSRAPLTAVVL